MIFEDVFEVKGNSKGISEMTKVWCFPTFNN